MGLHILGLGTATPPHMIRQDDAANLALVTQGLGIQHTETITKLYRKSGVSSRRCVILESSTNGVPAHQSFFAPAEDASKRGPTTGERMMFYQEKAADLAVESAEIALHRANLTGREITHLVTASCTGFHSPGVDLTLCERLELPTDVARTHIGFMGCHAALNAIRVANSFAKSDPESRVLVCAVELCSLHFQYSNRSEHFVSNSLFADGAASLVGKGGSCNSWGEVVANASWRLPNTSDLMSWKVGDHGFEMNLSSRVPGVIRRYLQEAISQWLAQSEVKIEDVSSWAIHPGGPRILDACEESLGLSAHDLEASRRVLNDYGNMSSPTVLFVLEELRREKKNGLCVMLAFGPGLVMEAALIKLSA